MYWNNHDTLPIIRNDLIAFFQLKVPRYYVTNYLLAPSCTDVIMLWQYSPDLGLGLIRKTNLNVIITRRDKYLPARSFYGHKWILLFINCFNIHYTLYGSLTNSEHPDRAARMRWMIWIFTEQMPHCWKSQRAPLNYSSNHIFIKQITHFVQKHVHCMS